MCLVSYCACIAPLALSPHSLALIQPLSASILSSSFSRSGSTLAFSDVAHPLSSSSSIFAASSPGLDIIVSDSIIGQSKADLSKPASENSTKISADTSVLELHFGVSMLEQDATKNQSDDVNAQPDEVDWMNGIANLKPGKANLEPREAELKQGQLDVKPNEADEEMHDATDPKPSEGTSKLRDPASGSFVLPRLLTLALTCDMVATSVVEALARWLYPSKPLHHSSVRDVPEDSVDEAMSPGCGESDGMTCCCVGGFRRCHRNFCRVAKNRKDRRARLAHRKSDGRKNGLDKNGNLSSELATNRGRLDQNEFSTKQNVGADPVEFDIGSNIAAFPRARVSGSRPSSRLPCNLGNNPCSPSLRARSSEPSNNSTSLHGAPHPCCCSSPVSNMSKSQTSYCCHSMNRSTGFSFCDDQKISSTPSKSSRCVQRSLPGSLIDKGASEKSACTSVGASNAKDRRGMQPRESSDTLCQMELASQFFEPVNLVLGQGQTRLLEVAG